MILMSLLIIIPYKRSGSGMTNKLRMIAIFGGQSLKLWPYHSSARAESSRFGTTAQLTISKVIFSMHLSFHYVSRKSPKGSIKK